MEDRIIKKIKTGTMLLPNTIRLCDDNIFLSNSKSRNEFIEKAIKHYVSYLHKDNNISYLNKEIDSTLSNKIDLLEEQLSSILFKLSVEANILLHIFAATTDIDTHTLEKIRLQSTYEVKRTVGKIDLEQIFSSYSMKEGD